MSEETNNQNDSSKDMAHNDVAITLPVCLFVSYQAYLRFADGEWLGGIGLVFLALFLALWFGARVYQLCTYFKEDSPKKTNQHRFESN